VRRVAGRKVALLGGAGFIGHHLALELADAGADVLVVDSFQVNNLIAVKAGDGYGRNRDLYLRMLEERQRLLREAGVPVLPQDARDYGALSNLLNAERPDVIVHLAAVSHANRSDKDPFTTFDHSLRSLENALDYARGNVDHFVYLSSSMAYGNWTADEVIEDTPLDPVGIYGALKAAGELIVKAYQQVFGLDYTIVRPSALYGPRCVSGRVGQVFIENAIAGEALRVRADGGGRLDFTYVGDLVQGIRLMIEHPAARNETFNLTYGEGRTIAEVAALVSEAFPDVEVLAENLDPDRLTPRRGTLSVEKARRLIGYEPSHPIEVGFRRYIDWYRTFVPEGASR
jgi:nucleoside-diphosphate-sugar epimerase